MFKILIPILLSLILEANNQCIVCHEGIEDIRDPHSKMMKEILKIADKAGYAGNDCIVCHGGNPNTKIKRWAHKGTVSYFLKSKGPKNFYPSPASPWINKNTCGMCHSEQVGAQYGSLMATEAGKIQGALWSFGAINGYKHDIANYDVNASYDLHKTLGTPQYIAYMKKLSNLNPQVFPKKMKALPPAPTAEEVQKDPKLAVYTYLRQECLRCHTGMQGSGRHGKGEFRGIGCSACHIPYSNYGYYEGNDKSIPLNKTGHPLVHRIQSTRKAKVKVHDIEYSGIPTETCSTCHNRGKRIGVSYQGLMETAYSAPYTDGGNGQSKLHGKKYMHLKSDIHMRKGMLCQDCHTSNDAHGDGMLQGANLGAVEIECQDCHGTTKKYPWELPWGYSDEFSKDKIDAKPRGLVQDLAEYLKMATVYDKKEGYLLTARGNPYGNVVKKDNTTIIVHLSSGKDIELKPLKALKEDNKLSKEALVAMDIVQAHTDDLECYTCHATWAPQCYGCHVKIDYSNGKKNVDWLKASHDHDQYGRTGDMQGNLKKYLVDGKVTETRSFLRWEDPPLSQNGEGRISPTIPGCQTTITVIGKRGNTLLKSHIFKNPNVEGAGKEGQLAIDMSPVQPHTVQKESRSCESCHTNPKAMGYGIDKGKNTADPSKAYYANISTASGQVLSNLSTKHIEAIKNLKQDYSVMIDENGTQKQTVGHHFKLSAPLNKEQLSKLDRRGVCLSCHQDIPAGDYAIDLMTHIADMSGYKVEKDVHNTILNKFLHLAAWIQVMIALIVGLLILSYLLKTRKRKNSW
jgi:hypothetical protein